MSHFLVFDVFWFIYLVGKCLSILELKGWPVPPSSWKYLKLNAALEQLDSLGISSFLLSSSGLETWVIDCCDGKSRVSFF